MNNFDLHTPTRILFGKGAIEKLREQIPAEARVLITYGGGSVKKNRRPGSGPHRSEWPGCP
ncbi:oxidoreductase YqhD [Klebsiella pneumoniae]|nr:oxidoreductase YqhD [Klebsiella pneumoniae]STV93924.1 oxidoreductase YqhD [Klebsiella pneumoniae]VTM28207.1 oxidoreductase YqhD [Klebsiella pneumoniae]